MFSNCILRLYNSWIVVYMNYFMFIHLQFYFCNFAFTRGDYNFDRLFFIKLIWWNRTRPTFSKFDQINLIKQKCVKFCCIHLPCISGLKVNWVKVDRAVLFGNKRKYLRNSLLRLLIPFAMCSAMTHLLLDTI